MFFLFLFVSSTGPGSKESIENAEPEQLPTLQSQFCEKDPVEKKKKKKKNKKFRIRIQNDFSHRLNKYVRQIKIASLKPY